METNLSLVLVFMEGLISFLSPCVLPIIPIYMGYLAGTNNEQQKSNKKVFLFTLSFILGIFSAIFLMNASINLLQNFFKQHMVLFARLGGTLIILLGIYQLGLIKINLLQRTVRFSIKASKRMNVLIAFAMGFTFSFAWTPCIGPALSSILILAASSGSFWYSNFLMIIYALGLTLPFLILGLFTNKALTWLNSHRNIVKYTTKVGAIILIIFGLMMFNGKLNTDSNYTAPDNKETVSDEQSLILSKELLDQNDQPISLNDYTGKVIFLNFWATWCPPCKEELPEIQKLSDKYKNSNEVVVLTVVMPGGREKDRSGIKAFLKENNYTMPVIFDDGSLNRDFEVTALPTTYMLTKDGDKYGVVTGQLTIEMMEDIIKQTIDDN